MKKLCLTPVLLFCSVCIVFAQTPQKPGKYPSILWEIKTKGNAKPSYLIGTMHISGKLVYNLPDSFYNCIRSVDVVALENDVERWQDDMEMYDLDFGNYLRRFQAGTESYITQSTLKVPPYVDYIKAALLSNPAVINNLLYRTMGDSRNDFEEDTFLDMFIYQCGKKYGKRTTGLENFGRSIQLMVEGYKDAIKQKDTKERSFEYNSRYSPDKIEDAYRSGNLDLLDSIDMYNSFSAAFMEKFLYRRNEIQANAIDSILQKGSAVFAGVGAAHLPGDRGVIELLRKKGYILRPVKMGARSSSEKDAVDKIRLAVKFKKYLPADSAYQVDVPGKMYKNENPYMEQTQYADMANGSYYMITRVSTNAGLWGHNGKRVAEIIDSLLYENIPGKILSKTAINRNGYNGFDITNQTRRGDVQRYNIFVTPFEVLVFKMSGNGNYVSNGSEANRFFGSIQLKTFKKNEQAVVKKFSPERGGFTAAFPQEPFVSKDRYGWKYDATDSSNGNYYRIVQKPVYNYKFNDEDTFCLSLLEESFKASEFIDKQYYRKQIVYKGNPALDIKFNDKNGNVFVTRFISSGPFYYSLIVRGKKENASMESFISSFEIKDFGYNSPVEYRDTTLKFSFKAPYHPEKGKIKFEIPTYNYGLNEDENEKDEIEEIRIYSNDTTGETVSIKYHKLPAYSYYDDSTAFYKEQAGLSEDSVKIFRNTKSGYQQNGWHTKEYNVSDTGSNKIIYTKVFFKQGTVYTLKTVTDSLRNSGGFVKAVFETFNPDEPAESMNVFEKKSKLFFNDFFSADTTVHKRAKANIFKIFLDSADYPDLRKAIEQLSWKEKNYLDTKESLIYRLGSINSAASSDFLYNLYFAAQDTVQIQYAVLASLLNQQTKYSYSLFTNIVKTEAPVIDLTSSGYNYPVGIDYKYYNTNGRFMNSLTDSLQLTKIFLADLLPLINLDDYKDDMMNLLTEMISNGFISSAAYENYFDKLLIEAKHLWRKQAIAEKKKSIAKAEATKNNEDADQKENKYPWLNKSQKSELIQYTQLLLPFAEKNTAAKQFINQLLKTENDDLRFGLITLFIKNKQPVPDSLLAYFAAKDEFRYSLFRVLKKNNKLTLFPSKYKNNEDLTRSILMAENYKQPDTLVFLKSMPAVFKAEKGLVYFYKYKEKKDDYDWKIASVGIVPADPAAIDFSKENDVEEPVRYGNSLPGKFSSFSKDKYDANTSLDEQLFHLLSKMLIQQRVSGKMFFGNNSYYDDEDVAAPVVEEDE